MQIIETVRELQMFLEAARKLGKIGFVPTMGALHKGHISLLERAKKDCKTVVSSIFVNPTQFNDPKDLEKYPRPIDSDKTMLANAGCDVLFLPNVKEIYNPGVNYKLSFEFGKLDKVMEGFFRPGHFDGMAQVVKRLLDIVVPDYLFMGQKDFQQLTIVRSLIKQSHLPVDLVMCETIREPDGLAMSSRNIRLNPELRKKASLIYETLVWAKEHIYFLSPAEISKQALSKLTIPGFKPEYFDIVDGISLELVHDYNAHKFVVVCVACWVGEVRLIDNLILKKPASIH